MKRVEGGYLLLEGSVLFDEKSDKDWKTRYKGLSRVVKIREKLNKNNMINENNKLKENLFDNYPSTLAGLVSGKSINGYNVWKTKDKTTLNKKIGRMAEKIKTL